MTDLEARLVDTLALEADVAPDATGLAARARSRARRRRRIRLGLSGAAVVAVVVPTVLLATSGSEPMRVRPAPVALDPSPDPTRIETSSPVLPEGWRYVRWAGLEVAVPGEWQDGSRGSWCAGGSPQAGRVERPRQPAPAIACSDPEQSYGLTFGSSAAMWPSYRSGEVRRYDTTPRSMPVTQEYVEDSWLGWWYDADRMVSVNAADRRTVELILATVRRVP